MSQHNSKVAGFTGVASVIGLVLAVKLAEQGCNLALVDRNSPGLMQVQQQVEKIGVRCIIHNLDVADNQAFIAFAERVSTEFSIVDLLFNNAGVSLINSVENQTLEDFH